MKISKIFAITQLSLMYISLICLFIAALVLDVNEVPQELMRALAITGFVSAILAGLFASAICVISFVSMFKRGTKDYTKFVMIYKLVSIPWFIGNFVFCALLIAGMLNPFLLIAIPLVIAILMLSTYVCMLSSSMIDVGYVISAMKSRIIKPNAFLIIGLVLEFFFCTDAIGSIFIFIANKKQLKTIEQ